MNQVAEFLTNGTIGVLATDTLYGIVARAFDPAAVQKVYDARHRNPDKPCIILLAGKDQLELFGIKLDAQMSDRLNEFWPGPVSIILPCDNADLAYLHRGTNSLAFRVPAKPELQELLRQTGPLIAPSANLEGQPPARTLNEARQYFGNACSFYEEGETSNKASKLIQMNGTDITVLRP